MKKIFRFAIVCAVAGAALLTGCTKDFTSDIDNLKTELGEVKKLAKAAKDAIDAGAVITKVEDVAEGVKVTLSDGKTFTVKNGAAGKDATIWTIGSDGYWYENGTKTDKKAVGTDGKNGTEWTIGDDGYWYKNGTKTSVKATGADGKNGTEWTIGPDGYWYKDGAKTDVKAKGEDGASGSGTPGATGATGNYWKPDVDNNQWVEYTSEDVATGKTMAPLYTTGPASGVTAIWDDEKGTLEFANVEGKADGKLKIDLTTKLKSLAFVPEYIFDGLGLINATAVYAPKVVEGESAVGTIVVKGFPTLSQKEAGEYVTSADIKVAYRANPQNIKIEDYAWDFVNREVITTKAAEDKSNLVSIVSGPEKHGNHYDFTIKINDAVKPLGYSEEGVKNDIVALRATANNASIDGASEIIVSDYQYLKNEVVKDFHIIHKDGEFLYNDGTKDVVYEYDSDDPKFYRWEKFVAIDEPTDFNNIPTPTTTGIDTPDPGTGKNPKAIALPYNGTIDLLDYVDTYCLEKKDLASTLGINPEYTFQFAGLNEATNEFLKGTDPDKVVYLAADVDKTNQNKFIKGITKDGTGHVISVNDAFVSLLSPAIGRTPLIYVKSFVKDAADKEFVLAECLIKLEITAEEAPTPEGKGWDVFIWHDVTFPNTLPATATYIGKKDSGTASAPHLKNCEKEVGNDFAEKDDDLNVTWDEVNPWVLNAVCVNMSYEDFGDKYDLSNPKLILAEGSKEPGAALPAKDKAVLVDPADINTYYSASGSGLTITSQSPSNWKQSTNIVDLKIDNTFKELNKPADGKHYVYVVYPAKDNTKNIDVVVKFSFKVEPHVHTWTILKRYNDKSWWILNPDYIQGPQDLLIEGKPAADAYYGEGGLDAPAKYETYGAVRVKGLENDLRSSFVEHFKEYANCWKNANEESNYIFKIYNYINEIVDIVEGGTTTAIANEAGYATVTISGADLKKMAEGTMVSPDILVKKPAGLSVGKDILVQVTEVCKTTAAGVAVTELEKVAKDYTDKVDPYIYGEAYVQAYYYVLFEAIKPTVKFNEVKLGDFKDQNDYALYSEIVTGVFESDAADAIALFEWQPEVKDEAGTVVTAAGWKLGPSAATYGITDATKISFKINKLIYGLNDKDTEDSFKGRLSIFEAGDSIEPWPIPLGSVAEGGINWRNDGTNLEQDKVAGFELEVFYDGESLTKGNGNVTVMKTNSKPHPNHNQDGSIWE